MKKEKEALQVRHIAHGRFDYPTIWVDRLRIQSEISYDYPDSFALSVFAALALWKGLTEALVVAGQAGTLDAGYRESIR